MFLTLQVFRCRTEAVLAVGFLRRQRLLRLHREGHPIHQLVHVTDTQLHNNVNNNNNNNNNTRQDGSEAGEH